MKLKSEALKTKIDGLFNNIKSSVNDLKCGNQRKLVAAL